MTSDELFVRVALSKVIYCLFPLSHLISCLEANLLSNTCYESYIGVLEPYRAQFNVIFLQYCFWKKWGSGVYHRKKFLEITPFDVWENDTMPGHYV